MDSPAAPPIHDDDLRPVRPWAVGVLLVVVGLVIATIANVTALSAGQGGGVRALGAIGYGLGLLVAGLGVHRVLWFGPPRRTRLFRIVITALLTPPVFAAAGVFIGVFMTLFQSRFAS